MPDPYLQPIVFVPATPTRAISLNPSPVPTLVPTRTPRPFVTPIPTAEPPTLLPAPDASPTATEVVTVPGTNDPYCWTWPDCPGVAPGAGSGSAAPSLAPTDTVTMTVYVGNAVPVVAPMTPELAADMVTMMFIYLAMWALVPDRVRLALLLAGLAAITLMAFSGSPQWFLGWMILAFWLGLIEVFMVLRETIHNKWGWL